MVPSIMAALALGAGACSKDTLVGRRLLALKADDFRIVSATDREHILRVLVACAGVDDPVFRDEVGYGGFSAILRRDPVAADAITALFGSVSDAMNDALGRSSFAASFLPLYLAEIVRVDRVRPFLSDRQRSDAAALAARYLAAVRDYRGFEPEEGWRHQLAHTADLVLQLALNPKLDDADRTMLASAILNKVASPGAPALTHGAPERLARAYLYAVHRSDLGPAEIRGALEGLSDDRLRGVADGGIGDGDTLARLHNIKAFLAGIIIPLADQSDERLAALRAEALRVHRALP